MYHNNTTKQKRGMGEATQATNSNTSNVAWARELKQRGMGEATQATWHKNTTKQKRPDTHVGKEENTMERQHTKQTDYKNMKTREHIDEKESTRE